ncbi:MAG: hypothetical protein R3275_10955 [Saprospiraceae bacterium]|nr:hypothetical protein [Saprospiraceae bacterium]
MSRFHFYRSSGGIGQVLLGGLILVGLFIGLFWLARGIFTILAYLAPFLIIAALLINYKVVTGYLKWLWSTLLRDPLMGIIYIVLSFFGFPIVSAYLLFKALAGRRIERIKKDQQYYQEYRSYNSPDTIEAEYEVLEEDGDGEREKEDIERYEKLFNSD